MLVIDILGSGANNLGGPISNVLIKDISNIFFDPVSSNEARDGDSEYRCFYVKNNSSITVTVGVSVQNINIFSNKFYMRLGLGLAPVNDDEPTIPNENTAPSGVYFVGFDPTSVMGDFLTGVDFTLPASSYKSVWINRVILSNCPAQFGARATLKIAAKYNEAGWERLE